MTEPTRLSGASHPSSEEIEQRWVHRYAISRPAMTAAAFVAATLFAATASFGVEWARLAGASGWEAAVWPVAVTAVTLQAFYCGVRATPGWYPSWARYLFAGVGGAGFLLICLGSALSVGGHPRALSEAVSTLVLAVPGWSMLASVVVALTFMLAVRPPAPTAAAAWKARQEIMDAHQPQPVPTSFDLPS